MYDIDSFKKYGSFLYGICLDDSAIKPYDYIKTYKDKIYIYYFEIKDKEKKCFFIFNDLNIVFEYFPWKSYLNINNDLSHMISKKDAWNHWINHGKEEERAFSLINNSNIHNGRLGNIFFINMFLHIVSVKYNLKCSYKYKKRFKKLGIVYNKGKNMYKKNLFVTEDNFLYVIKNNLEPCNIIIHNDIWFHSCDFCKIIKIYFENNDIRNKILHANKYKNRYKNNNDIFIHLRLGDVRHITEKYIEYYDNLLSTIKYEVGYVSSDNINDNICKHLIKKHNLKIINLDEIETIMFGSTCNNIILSGGTFSWMIGFFAFFSQNIYYPKINNSWYGVNIFSFDDKWKCIEI